MTSKERMTIICGGEVKSRTGTGMRLTMYSHTASTLYFSWAEMGTMGAFSAMVPLMKSWMASCWFCAALSLQQQPTPLQCFTCSAGSAMHSTVCSLQQTLLIQVNLQQEGMH